MKMEEEEITKEKVLGPTTRVAELLLGCGYTDVVRFSDPCSHCGNRKRACEQQLNCCPRKKILLEQSLPRNPSPPDAFRPRFHPSQTPEKSSPTTTMQRRSPPFSSSFKNFSASSSSSSSSMLFPSSLHPSNSAPNLSPLSASPTRTTSSFPQFACSPFVSFLSKKAPEKMKPLNMADANPYPAASTTTTVECEKSCIRPTLRPPTENSDVGAIRSGKIGGPTSWMSPIRRSLEKDFRAVDAIVDNGVNENQDAAAIALKKGEETILVKREEGGMFSFCAKCPCGTEYQISYQWS